MWVYINPQKIFFVSDAITKQTNGIKIPAGPKGIYGFKGLRLSPSIKINLSLSKQIAF